MVVLVPVPVVVVPPGERVSVHVPEAGKPDKTTLPVGTEQVGWVTVPTVGMAGVTGAVFMITFEEAGDTHPFEFATVKWYVPAARPVTVVNEPVPVVIIKSGYRVKVQVPGTGNPVSST